MNGALSLIDLFGGPADAVYDPDQTLDHTAGGMECEARIRRALSRLAAAQAAHCESPGSDEHRNRLVTAAFHAEIAQDLAHNAAVARERIARQDRIEAARTEFHRGFNPAAVAAE